MRVLALSPHTDDVELGCGGSLAHWAGAVIQVIAFSPCGSEQLAREFSTAMARLDVSDAVLHRYPRRRFHEHRQTILEDMLAARRDFQPDLVLAPSSDDAHQDHQVVAAEAFRAFRHCSLWAYELPWNHATFTTRAFVRLTQEDLNTKCDTLAKYRTQHDLLRPYFDRDFILGLARVRGVQVGAAYAEAFDVVREVR